MSDVPLEPYIEKCGKGTAWYGDMIREQMRAYAAACRADERRKTLLEAADGQLANATDQLRSERNALREFVAALFEAMDWPEGGDLDSFTFQDLCEGHGILLPETRTAPCREGCHCDEYHGGAEGMADGVICYRKPQWLIDSIRGLANQPAASLDMSQPAEAHSDRRPEPGQ